MRIAVTSQNRKTITGHAGKCRKFWVYDVADGQVSGKSLLELSLAQSFHESPSSQPHPLDHINVLICGGLGKGLQSRLKQKGIQAVATAETDPDRAVSAWLTGDLASLPADDHAHGHHHLGLAAHQEIELPRSDQDLLDRQFLRIFQSGH